MAIDKTTSEVQSSEARATRRGRRQARSGIRRTFVEALHTKRGMFGAALVATIVLIAALGPVLAPTSPAALGGIPFGQPTSAAPLGYDVLGRNVLSRVLNGGWEILVLATIATFLGVGGGTIIGVVAAYSGSKIDTALMRVVDVILAFPALVLALLFVSIAGPSVPLLIIAVMLCHLPQVARVVRAAALEVCELDYVKAIELLKMPRWRIVTGEIVPGVVSVIMVEVGLRLTLSILIIAGLSFLGFGLQPPSPNWGLMISDNRIGITQNAWSVIVPAGLIAVLTVGTNTFTDAVARVTLGLERGGSWRSAEDLEPEVVNDVAAAVLVGEPGKGSM